MLQERRRRGERRRGGAFRAGRAVHLKYWQHGMNANEVGKGRRAVRGDGCAARASCARRGPTRPAPPNRAPAKTNAPATKRPAPHTHARTHTQCTSSGVTSTYSFRPKDCQALTLFWLGRVAGVGGRREVDAARRGNGRREIWRERRNTRKEKRGPKRKGNSYPPRDTPCDEDNNNIKREREAKSKAGNPPPGGG